MKPRFMLETSTCVLLMNRRSVPLARRIGLCHPGDLCMSSITEAELEFGVANSLHRATNRELLVALRAQVPSMPFDGPAAGRYGAMRARLRRTGRLIGPLDLLIAAHAVSLGLTLVSDNTDEFRRVRELALENWAR